MDTVTAGLPPAEFAGRPLGITEIPAGASWLRLSRRRFADPLGYGSGPSRFSDPEGRFAVAYFGESVKVCFLETVIRDRSDGRLGALPIEMAELEDWQCAAAAPTRALRIVDLRDEGALRIGMPSDAIRARDQRLGRAWSAALWAHDSKPDGLVFPSRLNTQSNLALFNRAMSAMRLTAPARPLLDRPEMSEIVRTLELAIV